jgi:hypothetical protein
MPAAAAQPHRAGILLTPIKLLFVALFVIFGMGFAFAGGMLLGWYLHK